MPVLMFLFLLSEAMAGDVFIKSLKAPVLAEPKSGAATVQTLERGAKAESIGQEGAFLKLKSPQGFVNKLFVSDKPVESKGSILNQDIDISSKARKRASGFTSAAAARGLKQDSDEVFKALGDADPKAIKKMESLLVDERTGVEFLSNKKKDL